MPTILAVVTDTHINSTVGLSLPRLELDDGGDYRASTTQRWLYDCWTDFWDEVEKCSQGARLITLFNGDITDIDTTQRTHQLISRNKASALRHAAELIARPVELSERVVFVRGTQATPPTANQLLWLAADTNALTFGVGDLANSVYEWDDMSGTGHHAVAPNNGDEGLPVLGTAPFANAVHPVLHFYGTNALQPLNKTDFFVQNFTVYLVGSVDNRKASRDWIGAWEGWCLGTSDGSPGVIKWVTHTTVGD